MLFNYLHVMLHFRCSTWERKAMSHCTSSSPLFSLSYFALAFLDFPSFLDLIVSLLAVPLPVFFCHVRSFPSVLQFMQHLFRPGLLMQVIMKQVQPGVQPQKIKRNISVLTPCISLTISHACFLDMGREYFPSSCVDRSLLGTVS